jgi:hypothetical protein
VATSLLRCSGSALPRALSLSRVLPVDNTAIDTALVAALAEAQTAAVLGQAPPLAAPPLPTSLIAPSAAGATGHAVGVEAPSAPPAGVAAPPPLCPAGASSTASATADEALLTTKSAASAAQKRARAAALAWAFERVVADTFARQVDKAGVTPFAPTLPTQPNQPPTWPGRVGSGHSDVVIQHHGSDSSCPHQVDC